MQFFHILIHSMYIKWDKIESKKKERKRLENKVNAI